MTFIKYLFKKFLPVFLGALFFFSLILILVDLLINIWDYTHQVVPVKQVAYIMLLYIPKTISFSVPLSILFASSYVISDLYAKNELTSIFASGVSLVQFTLPLLIFSVLLSFGLFAFEDLVVVPTYAKKTETQQIVLKKQKSLNNDKIVVLGYESRTIYKADYYDDNNKRLYGLYIIKRDENNNLTGILRCDSAFWKDDKWTFVNSTVYNFTSDGKMQVSRDTSNFVLDEQPETFRNNVINVDAVNTTAAREYIAHLRKTGLPSAEAMSQYYKKFSFPFVVFIVVFLSIGLSGKTRKNVLLISLVLCLAAAVLFYVTQMVTMLLAKFGYIPPLAAAWFPVILFVALSAIFVRYTRT